MTIALLVVLWLGGPAWGQQRVQRPTAADPSMAFPAAAAERAPRDTWPHEPPPPQPGAQQVERKGAIPIEPPRSAPRRETIPPGTGSTSRGMATVVVSSLAIVLGLFFVVVWLSRRAFPQATAALPRDVLEVLGRSPLASRQQLQLIRIGRRLVLVSVTAEHAETLTEITDPDEVHQLTSLCRQQQPGSVSDSFRQVLHQLGSTPSSSWAGPRAGQEERDPAPTVGLAATRPQRDRTP